MNFVFITTLMTCSCTVILISQQQHWLLLFVPYGGLFRCQYISNMTSNYMCMNNNKLEYLPLITKTAAVAALVDGSVIPVGDATITA